MKEIKINTEYIKLDQLLKFENLVESGSTAKYEILSGKVKVNGNVEYQRGKKIYKDDIIEYDGIMYKVN